MGTTTEIRKWIDDFKKFEERNKRFELLVSYDCSNKHNPFRTRLQNLLVKQKGAQEINESLYKLPEPMNMEQVCNLAGEIDKIFNQVLNESATEISKTNVQFILPEGNSFELYTIIEQEA